MRNRRYKRHFIILLNLFLVSQVTAVTTRAAAQELQKNMVDRDIDRQVLASPVDPKGGLVDPLAHARRATIYVGSAVNVKGMTSNGFYTTDDIEFHTQATGFLYAYPVRNAHRRMKVIERTDTTRRGLIWNGVWMVTCKHCVEGEKLIGVRINTVDGGTRTYLSAENEWTIHPTMDVAVAMLPLGRDTRIDFDYLERAHAVGRQGLKINQLNEGTPVVIIGYPTGMIRGGRMNYPVIREGYIGQIQGYLANDPHHPNFLVAGSVFPGNSGGPVLVPAGIRKPMGMELGQTVLIGMVCAQRLAPTTAHDGVPSRVSQSADLAVVVPVDVIDETIKSSAQWQSTGY